MYNRKKRPEKIVSVPDEVKVELAEVVKQGFISTHGQSNRKEPKEMMLSIST